MVKKEFIYNNPEQPIRSEKINLDEEPWDCFTELNLDSIDQAMRNESEKSVILAPFNSSISDFEEEEWKKLSDFVKLECDGQDMTSKLKENTFSKYVQFFNVL